MKRNIEVLILSDIHLGTYGCRAKELVTYLKSVKPEMLVLNGDIIDVWQFSKNYFPKSHIEVVRQILKFAVAGVPIYYITGNHDDALRRFSGFSLGNFHLEDKLMLDLNGKKAWIFHGDVFDASIKCSRWLAKLGGYGYTFLILINVLINFVLSKMGRPKMSFSKKIKRSVKKAVAYVSDFEETAASIAIDRQYDYVICGHIHTPQHRIIRNEKGSTIYLNSGDWIENLSALEYNNGEWEIYRYPTELPDAKSVSDEEPSPEQVMQRVMEPGAYVSINDGLRSSVSEQVAKGMYKMVYEERDY